MVEKNKKNLIIIYFSLAFFGLSSLAFLIPNSSYNDIIRDSSKRNLDSTEESYKILALSNNVIKQGNGPALNISDIGYLKKYNQKISLENAEPTNTSYYLDDENNWKSSEIITSVNNIQDTRDWVQNQDYSDIEINRVNVSYSNIGDTSPPQHNYEADLESDPTNPSNIHTIITQNDAIAIRVHFSRLEIEDGYDIICLYNQNNTLGYVETGTFSDHFSPWILGNELKITIDSDGSIQWYGYDIDYYQFLNDTDAYSLSTEKWGYNNSTENNNYGAGMVDNESAFWVSLNGTHYRNPSTDYFAVSYNKGDFVEIYQNLTIPRGKVVDAYLSFDYYGDYIMETNENYIYLEINDKEVYWKGLRNIVEGGRKTWQSTGQINLDSWVNTTSVFDSVLNNQELNISVGIRSGATISYSGFQDRFQQVVWFDNISLILTTVANSTQEGIELTVNNYSLTDGSHWGVSSTTIDDFWDQNPIELSFNSSSPSLSFNLNTTIYGYHNTTSRLGQSLSSGVNYEILENGYILWEFYHNFYMPSEYSDFYFRIEKPVNWEFISVLDPTLNSREYEQGMKGDKILKINTSNAIFPGWWKFTATSPNFINYSNIIFESDGQKVQNQFLSGDSVRIKSQLNHSDEIPSNLGDTPVNLTIYDPEGNLWYKNSTLPHINNGSVVFPELYFESANTTGGRYNFTLFWSNGTALGGQKSYFIITHNSTMELLRPYDAVNDYKAEAFLGDIIALKILFKDEENNDSINNGIIYYNWSSGIKNITGVDGIYEVSLYTEELGSNGLFNIFINSSLIGYFDYNFTLQIYLVEETNLQRVSSESVVEYLDNNTVKFKYIDSSDIGIGGAEIGIDIDSSYYKITDTLDGNYSIEFSTSYLSSLGSYQITFNFSSEAYEFQENNLQFEVIKQSVEIFLYMNGAEVQETDLIEVMFKEELNISVRVYSEVENSYLSGGNITWNAPGFEENITAVVNNWFNETLIISSSNYSTGLNYIYLEFRKENYELTSFGFQLLIDTQDVNITLLLNGNQIEENDLIDVAFKEETNISARVYGLAENEFLSGGNVSWISERYEFDFDEKNDAWFNESLTIDGANLDPGLNYITIQFSQGNYTTTSFSFQLYITQQAVNLTVQLNSAKISQNYQIDVEYNDNIRISANAYATSEKIYLSAGNFSIKIGTTQINLTKSADYWFNGTISCAPSLFSLGINYVYLQFIQTNYTTTNFAFQIKVDQIAILMETIDFEDSVDAYKSEDFTIKIKLTDSSTGEIIDNAKITFSWDFGVGNFEETGKGIYELILTAPQDADGSFTMNLIIAKDGTIYKAAQSSIVIVITEREQPSILLWIVIPTLTGAIAVLGALSLRSYVILPRKRKKLQELLDRTQRYKDLQNIQAVVVIHKLSGIPLYTKSYSILEQQKRELFSGFIQAVTQIGEEFVGGMQEEELSELSIAAGVDKVMELDFKYFYCLIAERGDLRVVFILKEKSSERMKDQLGQLLMALDLNLAEELEFWDGSLDKFEREIPPILEQYFELYYKEFWKLANPAVVAQIRKESDLSTMETRVINVIYSIYKGKNDFMLPTVLDLISEKNKDLVIDAIESLIERNILIPSTSQKNSQFIS